MLRLLWHNVIYPVTGFVRTTGLKLVSEYIISNVGPYSLRSLEVQPGILGRPTLAVYELNTVLFDNFEDIWLSTGQLLNK